jgi:hypothetical protein
VPQQAENAQPAVAEAAPAPTLEELLDLGSVNRFFEEDRERVEVEMGNAFFINQQRGPLNRIFILGIENALQSRPSAQWLLRSNHPGKIYVCSLCEQEVVEPRAYFLYPGTNTVISSNCYIDQRNPVYTIQGQQLIRENFIRENRPEEPARLSRFRQTYGTWSSTILNRFFQNIQEQRRR